jgi:putative transposase
MPRQARIDAPGALHHIIVRGIDRTAVFVDDIDRNNFIKRLSRHLSESQTACYAWALMTNHAHLLLRTGNCPIATVMRRLLTGYAVSFNHRHRRHGHLFQNRYKSILCEEDAYLKQLVAYVHLNPLRAGIVENLAALKAYPFTGHSALMGLEDRPWQDTRYVLALFGRGLSDARRNLQRHVAKWAMKGRCPELTGGGLIRSSGGWRAVGEAYREGIRLASDERILGSSEFVEQTLKGAGEEHDHRVRLRSAGVDLASVVEAVCRHLSVDQSELASPTKRAAIARARALIACMATQDLSIPGSEVARRLNVDRSAVSRAVQRVRQDEEVMADVKAVWGLLKSARNQR